MGKVRGKTIKTNAKKVMTLYYNRLSRDFDNNLSVIRDVSSIASKKLRNQLAGYVTHLFNRIQKHGSVKGVYIKSHEEDREKKENIIPKIGVLDTDLVRIDRVTQEMLNSYSIQGNFTVFNQKRK